MSVTEGTVALGRTQVSVMVRRRRTRQQRPMTEAEAMAMHEGIEYWGK